MERFDVFKDNYLVYGLPEDKIREIAELALFEVADAGETLIKKGDHSGDLFVVLDGEVIVLDKRGDKLISVGPGSVLGEVALVDAGPRSAEAVANVMTAFAKLPADKLRRYMASNKDVGFIMLANLSRVLSARLRQSSIEVEELRGKAEDPWQYAT